ncbi:MAG: zinc ribbon domain-containing protein [Nitrososphaeria archaeon]|nr:zinc ribbon domain-containing protein [Nitrososphaeria archaeon]
MLPMILTAVISNILIRSPKLSPLPPIIGGLLALLTSHLLLGHPPNLPSQTSTYIYYSASTFASGAIALILSLLRRGERPREVAEEVGVEEVVEELVLRCPHCEREIPSDSIFCPLCGGKLREEVET